MYIYFLHFLRKITNRYPNPVNYYSHIRRFFLMKIFDSTPPRTRSHISALPLPCAPLRCCPPKGILEVMKFLHTRKKPPPGPKLQMTTCCSHTNLVRNEICWLSRTSENQVPVMALLLSVTIIPDNRLKLVFIGRF